MKRKVNFKIGAFWAIILGVLLLAPALSQSKDKGEEYKKFRTQVLKQLKLPADKEKAFVAVGDKYAADRQQDVAALKKTQEDLQAALAAPKPDEAKLKGLIAALTSDQDKLFASFKKQRDEELALLSPVEQGKYLMAMSQWRREMMKEHKKK